METTFSSHNNCNSLRLSATHYDSLRLLAIIWKPGLTTSFHVASSRGVNFMVMQNLKICKGFDHENDLGCKVSPRTNFDGQIPHKAFIFIFHI